MTATGRAATPIVGVDFSSAPTRTKPIVVARCALDADRGLLRLLAFESLPTLAAFDDWLAGSGPWIGGFDLPFGLPRAFIAEQGWDGLDWAGVAARVAALTRAELVARCRSYAAARPPGAKFAHRATDRPAGSSPSMKWVNPPVVLMLHAGVPRLIAAGVALPAHGHGHARGPSERVALEAYPGLIARRVVGRISYKSDDPRQEDGSRGLARERIASFLEQDGWNGIRMAWSAAIRQRCVADRQADLLDAVLCAVQAGWAALRQQAGWGLPDGIDPVEGWITGA